MNMTTTIIIILILWMLVLLYRTCYTAQATSSHGSASRGPGTLKGPAEKQPWVIRKHNSTRKRDYARMMLPLMPQIWFHILGRG